MRVERITEGRAEGGYLRENMSLGRMRRPMAWTKRHADDNLFVVHLFAPNETNGMMQMGPLLSVIICS